MRPESWPRVVWWSFYEGDASFGHFLGETLGYLRGGRTRSDKPSKQTVIALLELLHAPGTLLVLDGFERELRAFGGLDAAYQGDEARTNGSDRDCISPLAEAFLYHVALHPNLRSKVLLTTRLCPSVLETKGGGFLNGCLVKELRQLQTDDAVAFFHARGVRGTYTEIEAACRPYGFHPLSLTLLAGLIVNDVQQPGEIAAAKWLDIGGKDEQGNPYQRQHKNHVLETAYNTLTPSRQKLMGRIRLLAQPCEVRVVEGIGGDGRG